MNDTRKQVMAEIIGVIREVNDRGADGFKVAQSVFPAVPTAVIAEAWCEAESEATEAWWQTVERTIEGEVIRRAISE